MSEASAGPTWVLKVDAVRAGIEGLQAIPIHPYFLAYLHLRQRAGLAGGDTELKPVWKDLGPYLEVAGATTKHPYFRPFWDGAAGAGQHWLNGNLAGSFAYSSLRAASPPMLVVDYDEASRTFSLKPKHWQLAQEHLLHGNKIPAESIALFLLRDYGFMTDWGKAPTSDDLVELFATEFGYGNAWTEFNYLYDRVDADNARVWFERLPDGDS